MLANINENEIFAEPHSPDLHGYRIAYRAGETNHCPGCGRSHWYVGRLLAECEFCGTAIPLSVAHIQSAAGGHSRNRKLFVPSVHAA